MNAIRPHLLKISLAAIYLIWLNLWLTVIDFGPVVQVYALSMPPLVVAAVWLFMLWLGKPHVQVGAAVKAGAVALSLLILCVNLLFGGFMVLMSYITWFFLRQ